jgi:hypothetical protein
MNLAWKRTLLAAGVVIGELDHAGARQTFPSFRRRCARRAGAPACAARRRCSARARPSLGHEIQTRAVRVRAPRAPDRVGRERWIGRQLPARRGGAPLWLERTGHRGTGSNFALSFERYGRRLNGPQVGAVAVMARRGGGHVGVVSGVLPNGDVKVISGNHGHRVAESVYGRGRILAFVLPTT